MAPSAKWEEMMESAYKSAKVKSRLGDGVGRRVHTEICVVTPMAHVVLAT